ncbi:MAG: hypothetical protein H8E46_07890 [FCB group bacterium]|nr:hypothetical protein [FCB group bacterium]
MTFNGYLESHTHSAYSDGVFSDKSFIEKIYHIRQVNRLPLKTIAVTDHDSLNGYEPLIRCNEEYAADFKAGDPFKILPGIEFTTSFLGTETHILGYFPEFDGDTFNRILKPLAEQVIEWNEIRMLNGEIYEVILAEQFAVLGIDFDFNLYQAEEEARKYYHDDCVALDERKSSDHVTWKANVSRGCMRKALEKQLGIPEFGLQTYTIREHSSADHVAVLRDYFLAKCRKNRDQAETIAKDSIGKILYSGGETLSPLMAETAVSAIARAGGAAVFAHPGETVLNGISDDSAIAKGLYSILELKQYGLSGIEAFYPSHSKYLTERLLNFSRENDLVICGGSDWHGKSELQHSRFGQYSPDDSLNRLFEMIY